MNKWSILVLLFVFAVPFKAYSDNFMIASSDEITLAQIAPVSPQAGNVRVTCWPNASCYQYTSRSRVSSVKGIAGCRNPDVASMPSY